MNPLNCIVENICVHTSGLKLTGPVEMQKKVGQRFDDLEFKNNLVSFCFPSCSVTVLSQVKYCFHQRKGNRIGNFRKML